MPSLCPGSICAERAARKWDSYLPQLCYYPMEPAHGFQAICQVAQLGGLILVFCVGD